MKKIIGMILMVVILFSTTILVLPSRAAIAENEINLPNGLQFGMSLSEATAVSGYRQDSNSSTHDALMTAMGFDCDYLYGDATIGGYAASIEIYFENDYLRQIRYNLGQIRYNLGQIGFNLGEAKSSSIVSDISSIVSDINEELEASWISVGDALKGKYGQPQESSHQFKNSSVMYSSGSGKYKRKEWDYIKSGEEFVVNVNGGSVYIDNNIVNRSDTADTGSLYDFLDTNYYQNHYLTYTFYDFQVDSNTEKSNSVDF